MPAFRAALARRAGFGVPFTRMLAAVRIIAILGVVAGLGALVTADARQGASVTPDPSASGLGRAQAAGGGSDVAAMFGTYCLTCHNTRTRTGNLTLEGFSLAGVHDDAGAEVGEKIVRRLRTGMMPPPGMPRPNEATIAAVVLRLESTLDEAAHRRPQTGRAMLRRLNRAEYANAVRDLLALDIDAGALVPADNAAFGLDNIAEALGVSPSLQERYLAAAETLAALAVGDDTGYFYGTACVHPKWVRRADNGWVFIFPSRVPGVMQYGLITALDSRTNRIAWQKKVPYAVCAGSGTSVTAGGILFHQSPDGTFLALDARTGEQVWQFQTGEVGAPSGNGPGGSPIAVYEVGGQQYVALSNNRHLWAFTLGGQVPQRPAPAPPPAIVGWEGRIVAATSITLGSEEVFNIRTANRKEAWTDPYSVTPTRARLAVGSAVTWTNTSRVAHTIVARDGSWTTGPIQPGGTASVTMGRAGRTTILARTTPGLSAS